MNVKSQKGFTGIDITIAIIVITLFVSIISVVFYNITISSKKVERKTEATYIAQDVIEKIKALNYDDVIETKGTEPVEISEYKKSDTLIIDNKEYDSAYTIEIKVKKYVPNSNGQENNDSNDLVKIVNVNVLYKIGKEVENVELTTTIVRNR
jgi:type II secretory pathway pseudopilin PulG